MGATLILTIRRTDSRGRHFARCTWVFLFCALSAPCATGQDRPEPASGALQASSSAGTDQPGRAATIGSFLLGGAAGLGLHEGGHLLFDAVFGVKPELKAVHFGPIPFFAISHRPEDVTRREEFAISSAGFWMQHLSSEIILTRHPGLVRERSPMRKGLVAFNVLASLAYGAAAMAKAGPVERDTRAMADSLGVSERWIGALVLAPAVLDAWRYFHPDAAWAAWLSRGVKVGSVLLVVK